jgi:DNA-binding CsgD family transcriptional regulator/PAS domain-containing protein
MPGLIEESDFAAAIQLIYDAALEPLRWQDVLARIGELVDSERAALYSVDPFADKGGLVHTLNVDTTHPELERLQLADLRLQALQGRRGQIYTDERNGALFRQFLRTETYEEIFKPQESPHLLGVLMPFGEGGQAALGFHRRAVAGSFREREASILAQFLPHIERALQIHRQLSHARAMRQVSTVLIEQLPVGILLLAADGHVLHANPAARRVLHAGDGLFLRKGRLGSGHPEHARRIARAIAGAAALRQGRLLEAKTLLHLSRPSGRAPYRLIFAPTGHGGQAALDHGAAALIALLHDPAQAFDLPRDVLERHFRFTPAEARLAQGLLRGHSLDEIAQAHDLARETVRAELKRVFRKCGVHSQAELMRYLLAGLVPLAGPYAATAVGSAD